MGTQLNSDGLHVRFGRSQGERLSRAAVTRTAGKEDQLVIPVILTGAARTIFTADRNNDGTLDGFVVGLDSPIPAGSYIKEVTVLTEVAPAGGTNYTVGTFQVAGTAIDADGLLTTVGAAGAQVATTIAEPGYIGVVTTGTYTAGTLKILVKYIRP